MSARALICICMAILPLTWATGKPCGLSGSATEARLVALNVQKNRSACPAIDRRVTLEKILRPGDDRARFDGLHGAVVTGYVAEVKDGGSESCNCNRRPYDTHIGVVQNPQDYGNARRYMIVEVTPRLRALHPWWTTPKLKAVLLHRKVTFTGGMFFDSMHLENASNTNPRNKKNWRATCWEIHPVTAIRRAG
jgi:hypothetical protein